jgi:type I restriction enzyme, S subunit
MGGYQRYEAYQDSGIEWLGEIPAHWDCKRAKYVFLLQRGYDLSRDVMEAGDYPVCASNGIIGYHAFWNVKAPSITVGRSGSVGEINYIESDFWAHNTALFVKYFFNSFQRFIFYLLMTLDVKSLSFGTAVGSLNRNHIHRLFLGVPPLEEQKTIARFLDYKTAQIDALIAKKESLLKKLAEKRSALISQAVTKGLDAIVPMQDSGVEWLGEIPAHWEVVSLRYACEFLNRRRIPLSSEQRALMSQRIYPYYGASGIIDYVEDFIFDEPTILIAEDGANLLSRSTHLAFIASGMYWVNNHAHILKPLKGVFEYWSNLLCIIKYDPWITGSAQPKLTKDNLGSIRCPLPPYEEQKIIANFLSNKISEVDKQVEKVNQAIDRLKEYRTALITNAVTGAIDVRNVRIPNDLQEAAL